MTSALLSTGTELTRGDLVNTNTTWLAERLSSLGHQVTEMVTVDDDEERLVEALERLARRHAVLVVTGGLGPTTDDLTSAAAARALGAPLERDLRSLARIEALFASRNLPMQPSNAKQADFPRGARILDNDHGTAPGFALRLVDCEVFFLPGVPSEMRAMFEASVEPSLPPPEAPSVVRRLRTFGMPESRVNDTLAGLEAELGVLIGYRASNAEIEVKVMARQRAGESMEDVVARAELGQWRARELLGDVVYAEGSTTLEAVLGELLLGRGLTLGVAESCTGGLVSQLLTSVPGASAYYCGGICCYSNSSKEKLLGVPAELIAEHGAVSSEVALALARGARQSLGSDVALGITGIAGPSGGSAEKPVGLVHWAVAAPQGERAFSHVFRGDRAQIQRRAALSGLWAVRRALLGVL